MTTVRSPNVRGNTPLPRRYGINTLGLRLKVGKRQEFIVRNDHSVQWQVGRRLFQAEHNLIVSDSSPLGQSTRTQPGISL